jgi:hypothetical protein
MEFHPARGAHCVICVVLRCAVKKSVAAVYALCPLIVRREKKDLS